MSILRQVASVTSHAGDLRAIREATDEAREETRDRQPPGAAYLSPQRKTPGESAAGVRERHEPLALLPNSLALLQLDDDATGASGCRRTYYLAGLKSGALALLRAEPLSLERM